MSNIILTGFMGTGKSSVGRLLASRLGYRFRDVDEMIVAQEMMTINEIFEKLGEPYFRALETGIIKSIAKEDGLVVSTGGGAVISTENRAFFRKMGYVVNLTASPEAILERLAGDCQRPLLRRSQDFDTIIRMLKEREYYYADADIRIDTTEKKLDDVAHAIMLFLESRI